jgi:hypothetical protein
VTGVCALCGCHGPVEAHHIERRPAPGAPYFGSVEAPLCKVCHDGLHVGLRRLGLDFAGERDPLAYRVLLVGDFAHRVAAAGRAFVLAPSAARALGDMLVEAADALAASRSREGAA